MLADNIKIFCRVGSLDDCLLVQKELDNMWCAENLLELNVSKC